jgi:hypothetical protein
MSKKSKKEKSSVKIEDWKSPCDLDHNGECLICDCWISSCGWKRLLTEDYKYESKDELLELFRDFLQDHPRKTEITNGKF